LNAKYYVCNVTTCQRKDTNFVFCTVDCWDAHVPTLRHKNAWAEERRAPATAEVAPPEAPQRRDDLPQAPQAPASEDDILIVASKLKAYIKAKAGMSTAAGVMEILSDRVRKMSDKAIHRAELSSRKTVFDRDVA